MNGLNRLLTYVLTEDKIIKNRKMFDSLFKIKSEKMDLNSLIYAIDAGLNFNIIDKLNEIKCSCIVVCR